MEDQERDQERKRLNKIQSGYSKWFFYGFILGVAGISIYMNESLIRDMIPIQLTPLTTVAIITTIPMAFILIICAIYQTIQINEKKEKLGIKEEDDI